MNRVLFVFTLAFICGILVLTTISSSLFILISTLATMLIIIGVFCVIKYKSYSLLIIAVAFVIGGILGFNSNSIEKRPMYTYVGEKVEGELLVTKNPQKTDELTTIECKTLNIDGKKIKEKMIVYIYGDINAEVNDIISFSALSISLPSEENNEGGFNYQKYLKGKNIFFTGSFNANHAEITGSGGAIIVKQAREINKWICLRNDKVIENKSTGGLLKALFIGDTNTIDPDVEKYFQLSGISHVTSVSGLHITIIVMILGVVLKTIRVRRIYRDICTFVVLFIFVIITGCSSPIIRSAIMLLTLRLSTYILRDNDAITSLSLVALILLLINPLTIYDVSFQLSFAATLGIVTMCTPISNYLKPLPKILRDSIGVTVAAQIGTLPLIIGSFGYIPILSIVANIVVTFLLPLIYTAGAIALVIGINPFIWISNVLLSATILTAKFLAAMPFATIELPKSDLILFGLFIITVSAMIGFNVRAKLRIIMVYVSAGAIIAVIGCFLMYAPPSELEVTFINVRQGDSALLRFPNGHNILIDAGTTKMGDKEVVPYLKRNGIRKLDAVFASHFHDDHAGGVIPVLENIKVDRVITPNVNNNPDIRVEIEELCNKKNVDIVKVNKGDVMRDDNIKISILSPKAGDSAGDENDTSIVMRLDYGESSYLFMGDATENVETTLGNVDVDVLKVGHHGSKTSTSELFIQQTSPEICVVSVGENNVYKLPDQSVIDNIEKYKSKIYRTDENGTIKLKSDIKGRHKVTVSR